MKRELKNHRGASLVEFALVLPLLLLLVFGIIEFGLLLYDKAVITNASREGARAGVALKTPQVTTPEIQNVVNTYCANHLVTFGGTNTVSTQVVPNPPGNSGTNLTVTVTYDYYFLVIKQFGSGGPKLRLTGTTVMVKE